MARRELLDIKFHGQKAMLKRIEYLEENFPKAMGKANLETAREIRDLARRNVKTLDAYDTHTLHDGIKTVNGRKAHGLEVRVESTAPHSPYIEFGTAPHFPPLAPIRAWCARKGLPESAAFPIAKKISEVGTPERPFLYPAAVEATRGHATRVREMYRELTAQLPGGKD